MTTSRLGASHVRRAAWVAWGVLFLVVAGLVVSGSDRTVTHAYWQAGADWLAGRALYAESGRGFIYLPQAAILFAPLSAVPLPVADISWRLLTIGAYACGVWRMARLVDRDAAATLFPPMTGVCLPLAFDCARNGQATLLVTALMILAVANMADRHWTRASAWLCLGVAMKPLGAFLLLLAAVLYRPMRVRLLAGLSVVAAIPFVTQHPEYVISQYQAWARMLTVGATVGDPEDWATWFGLLSLAGLRPSAGEQAAMQIAAAGLTIVICLFAARRRTTQAAVWIFAFHACFLMLFSPRTENNTYAVLAPAIAALSAQAWVVDQRHVAGAALASLAVVTTASYELGRRLLPDRPPTWLAPLMTVCFTIYAVIRVCRRAEAAPALEGSGD